MPDFIYNQRDIPKDQWRYGLRSSAAVGCGWIAVYNALHLLHRDVEIPSLIACLAHQVPLINGNLGTCFWGPARCFQQWGFPVKVHFDSRKFDQAAREAPASILFFRWKRGFKIGAHFAAFRFNGSQFIGFNTFQSSSRPDPWGDSLPGFLRQHGYFGAILITIQEPGKDFSADQAHI